MKMYAHALVVFLFNAILSLPTGAPICAIDEGRIAAGHTKPSDEALDYELSVNKKDENYEISINSKVETSFKGILIYVIGKDQNTHIGSFTLPNENFKFQTELCKSQGINGDAGSTITHANSNDKSLAETKFIWSSPSSKEDGLKVVAVVAKDRNPWRLVKELSIDPTLKPPYESMPNSCNSSTVVSTSASTTSTCTTPVHVVTDSQPMQKILKCTKIKKEWKKVY